jgi:hypothetical protein
LAPLLRPLAGASRISLHLCTAVWAASTLACTANAGQRRLCTSRSRCSSGLEEGRIVRAVLAASHALPKIRKVFIPALCTYVLYRAFRGLGGDVAHIPAPVKRGAQAPGCALVSLRLAMKTTINSTCAAHPGSKTFASIVTTLPRTCERTALSRPALPEPEPWHDAQAQAWAERDRHSGIRTPSENNVVQLCLSHTKDPIPCKTALCACSPKIEATSAWKICSSALSRIYGLWCVASRRGSRQVTVVWDSNWRQVRQKRGLNCHTRISLSFCCSKRAAN